MNELNLKRMYSDLRRMYLARIELTTKCNFKCKHCLIEDFSKRGLSTSEIFYLLDKLRDFGVYIVEFTGGEVFTRSDIMQIIRYARKLKFSVSILTNLSLLTDDIIKELDELSVERIGTTLFSMSDEINDKITGKKNSATTIIENLKKLSKFNMKIRVKTVLMRDNATEYKAIEDFCNRYGFEYLATEGIMPTVSGDCAPRSLAITESQLKNCIYSLDQNRYDGLFYFPKNDDTPICCELFYSLFIDAEGNCYPCNMWYQKLGNLKSNNYNLSEIWNHPLLEYARALTWKDLPKCSKCDNKTYCVRCTGLVWSINENLLQNDPFACRTARLRRELDISSNVKHSPENAHF